MYITGARNDCRQIAQRPGRTHDRLAKETGRTKTYYVREKELSKLEPQVARRVLRFLKDRVALDPRAVSEPPPRQDVYVEHNPPSAYTLSMERTKEIIFVVEDDPDRCHYDNEHDIPRIIRLHRVQDEILTYA